MHIRSYHSLLEMTKYHPICFIIESKLKRGIKPKADMGPAYLLSNLSSTTFPLTHLPATLAFFLFLAQVKDAPPSRSFSTQIKSHLLSNTYLSTLTEQRYPRVRQVLTHHPSYVLHIIHHSSELSYHFIYLPFSLSLPEYRLKDSNDCFCFIFPLLGT